MNYADSQAYGFAALFGLVDDLQLFVATIVDGKVVLNTTKYQVTSGISSIGGVVVSVREHLW